MCVIIERYKQYKKVRGKTHNCSGKVGAALELGSALFIIHSCIHSASELSRTYYMPVFLPGESHGQRNPGRLQSTESWRIRYNWVTRHTHICQALLWAWDFMLLPCLLSSKTTQMLNRAGSQTHCCPRGIYLQRNVTGFPGGSVVKNSPASAGDAGDTGLIHRSGRSPGEAKDNPH